MTKGPIISAALALALVLFAPVLSPHMGARAPVALAQDQQPGGNPTQAPAQQPGEGQAQPPGADQTLPPAQEPGEGQPQPPGGGPTQPPAQPPGEPQTRPPGETQTQTPPAPKLARGDRALLVGIDEYQEPAFKLKGSLNDVRNMRKLLTDTLGYQPEAIMTLTDAEATRDNILKAMDDWLVGGSAPGARVFFYMSGHGDEVDGVDETFVPYDARVELENGKKVVRNQVIDDEINDRLKRISDRKVTVVVDACHSGSRGGDLAAAAPGTLKCLSAALDGYESKKPVTKSTPSAGAKQGFIERRDNVVAWSAVNEGQLAMVNTETPEPQGVFTRLFIEGLAEKRADGTGDGTVSHAKLLDYVRKQSEAYCQRQKKSCATGLSPQLEASRGILLVDVATGRPPAKPQDEPQNTLVHSNAASVTVEPVGAVRVGQKVQYKITTQQQGYLVLLDISPDGKVTQIFPNAKSLRGPTGGRPSANLITPGRPLLVPDTGNPYRGFEYRIDPPDGEGRLVAVLSKEPIQSVPIPDLPKTFDTVQDGQDFVARMAEELLREPVVDGKPQKREWSVAIKPYRSSK
jgi:hypothetical protein